MVAKIYIKFDANFSDLQGVEKPIFLPPFL